MSAASAGAGAAWAAIIAMVSPAFTRPGFAIFAALADGWVLTPGRRTITRIIGVIDPEHRRAHDAYHRLVRDGAWVMAALWRSLAVRIVTTLCPDGPVALDLDDYAERRIMRRGGTGGVSLLVTAAGSVMRAA